MGPYKSKCLHGCEIRLQQLQMPVTVVTREFVTVSRAVVKTVPEKTKEASLKSLFFFITHKMKTCLYKKDYRLKQKVSVCVWLN